MKQDTFFYLFVRGKEIKVETKYESLSHLKIPKLLYQNSRLGRFNSLERSGKRSRCVSLHFRNLSFQRTGEDPTRMFAGKAVVKEPTEDFHYVSAEMPAKDFLQRLIL